MKFKIALLGCGRIAKRHAEIITAKAIQGIELAAVCDVNSEKAANFSRMFNCPAFASIKDAVNAVEIDAVVILTPSGCHYQNVMEVIKLKKHILVEKPIALKLDDIDHMVAEAKHNGLHLFVIKQNRFNKPVLFAKQALDAGRFGKLTLGTVRVRWCRTNAYYQLDSWRGTWRYDGGVLANQAIHHIDLLQWFMGAVDSVYAKGTSALADIEAEDTALAILKFKSGALGMIEASTATRPTDIEGAVSILGENGTIEIGGFAANELKICRFVDAAEDNLQVNRKNSTNPPDVYGFGHKEVYKNLYLALSGQPHKLVDGRGAKDSMVILNAIYESMETQKEVAITSVSRFENSQLGR